MIEEALNFFALHIEPAFLKHPIGFRGWLARKKEERSGTLPEMVHHSQISVLDNHMVFKTDFFLP